MGKELVTNMSKILPTETLKKFYLAFRDADPTHALIQCVDIMSDDQVRPTHTHTHTPTHTHTHIHTHTLRRHM